jgi:hypothetical protein
MKTVKALLIACGLAAGLLGAAGVQARAEDYGMVTMNNPTYSTVYYQFRWGSDGAWGRYSLAPGQYRCHYYSLDENGRAPAPYARFDNGVGNVKNYHLQFYGANRVNYYSGKKYNFAWSGPYVDLYSR